MLDGVGFRPLAGIMVLIGQTGDIQKIQANEFPSPCGDYGSYHFRQVLPLPT